MARQETDTLPIMPSWNLLINTPMSLPELSMCTEDRPNTSLLLPLDLRGRHQIFLLHAERPQYRCMFLIKYTWKAGLFRNPAEECWETVLFYSYQVRCQLKLPKKKIRTLSECRNIVWNDPAKFVIKVLMIRTSLNIMKPFPHSNAIAPFEIQRWTSIKLAHLCPRPSNPFWCPISNVDYLRLIV